MALPRDAGGVPGTFALRRDVDLDVADQLEPQLIAYARSLPGDEVEIDCTELAFLDSSGLGMLVDVQNETGKQIVLHNLPHQCRRVVELTGLDRVFKIA
jgi:anti-sigma B factor antagonist